MTLVETAWCNPDGVSPTAAAALSDVPFRDTFWNVPPWAQFLLYALSVVAIGIFALGMWQRIALWREGRARRGSIASRSGSGSSCGTGSRRAGS